MLQNLNVLGGLVLILGLSGVAAGQRPRSVTNDPQPASTPAPAPATVKAKYEGGVFGFTKKRTGTLAIDTTNSRLTFRDDQKTELFSIPFGSITGAYADSHSVTPAAATVASNVPFYGLPAAGLIKKKVRYLTVQYNDPDSKVSGATSFRLENKEILESVLNTVASNAGLTRRGDIYVRKKEP
jgi:hypothetical protein